MPRSQHDHKYAASLSATRPTLPVHPIESSKSHASGTCHPSQFQNRHHALTFPNLNADGRTHMMAVERLDDMAACMRVRRNGYLLKGQCGRGNFCNAQRPCGITLADHANEVFRKAGQTWNRSGWAAWATGDGLPAIAGGEWQQPHADSADLAGGAWQKRESVLGPLATRQERAIENVELLAEGRSVAWVVGAAGRVVTVLGASSLGQAADRIASQQLTGVANVILFVDQSAVLVIARRSGRDVVVDGFEICNRIAPKRAKT